MSDALSLLLGGGTVVVLVVLIVVYLVIVVAPLIQIVQLHGIRKALDSLQESNAQLLAQIYRNPNNPDN